jgi:DNA repair exonuclease SbcCD nuclease subunit
MSKNRDSFSNSPKANTRTNSSQTIAWLHLSDLHLSSPNDYNKQVVLDSLLHDIKESGSHYGLQPDLIIISGDIALTGRAEEYTYAQEFFDRLLRATDLTKDRLFIVPGNHDIDRTKSPSTLSYVSSALSKLQKVFAQIR